MVQVTTAIQDLSAGSGDWWECVREMVAQTYSTWLLATPLERLQVSPPETHGFTSGKWTRVNARACALMMQAFSESTKADLIVRRSTQSAVSMLFRVYTLYQPGGAAERGVVLRHLQSTDVPGDIAVCLDRLRSWPRWLQRCKDMGMTLPDGSLLARSLSATTNKFLTGWVIACKEFVSDDQQVSHGEPGCGFPHTAHAVNIPHRCSAKG